MKKIFLFFITLTIISCGESNYSNLSDIYTNDSTTRSQASYNQTLWSVYVEGCSGSALTPEYIITADHCMIQPGDKLKSGSAILNGSSEDIEVIEIAENNFNYDYSILKVKWLNQNAKLKQKYSPKISRFQSDLNLGKDSEASKIFTVGFPADKPMSMPSYAYGFAKEYVSGDLVYNIGTINGNSGGAVWRQSDFMLVSLTNAGPHQYRQEGWNNNDPEDEDHWNRGVSFATAYKISPLLKSIFPEGINPLTDLAGKLKNSSNTIQPEEPTQPENPNIDPYQAVVDPILCTCMVANNSMGRGCVISPPKDQFSNTISSLIVQSAYSGGCLDENSCKANYGHILSNPTFCPNGWQYKSN